jgi:hypothetical protein
VNAEALTRVVAKAVRDFVYYFGTTDHPRLEAWIEDAIRGYLE